MQNNVRNQTRIITGHDMVGSLLDSMWSTNNKEIRVDVQDEVGESTRFWSMSYFIVEDAVHNVMNHEDQKDNSIAAYNTH